LTALFQVEVDSIHDCVAEWSSFGRAAKKHIPDLIRECSARVTTRESIRSVRAANGQNNSFSLVLAGFDVFGYVGAVKDIRAIECVAAMTCEVQDRDTTIDLQNKPND